MKILGIHCPYCGGNIKFDIDSGKRHCFCVHCGQQIILDDEVIRTEHVEIKRDETKIHEADVNERIRLKELEMEENRRISSEKSKKTKLIVVLTIASIGVLMLLAGVVLGNVVNENFLLLMLFGGVTGFAAFVVWSTDS